MEAIIKGRKEAEDQTPPILLIGSRAFDNDHSISTKDWDLVMPHATFALFLRHHYAQFSYLRFHRGEFPKITGRLVNGQFLEIELVENYASNDLLRQQFANSRSQHTSNKFGAGQIKLKPVSNEALVALKYSTCFFPVNWTKNIRQFVAMKNKVNFDHMLKDENIRRLLELRSRETLARCLLHKQIISKQIVFENECKTADYITRAYEQYQSNGQNSIEFPLTGIKIDRTKFLEAAEAQKKILVEEQLLLLEHYFAPYGPEKAAELALEAFFTQSMPNLRNKQLNALLTKTHCVYTKSEFHAPKLDHHAERELYFTYVNDPERSDFFADRELYDTYLKTELPRHQAPLASDQEANQSTFNNVAIVWAMGHIEEFLDRRVVLPQRVQVIPALPKEVLSEIANRIDDHITLARFACVSKATASAVTWEHLVKACWSEEDLVKYRPAMSAPQPDWRKIFHDIYQHHVSRTYYMCAHCGGNHPIWRRQEWDQFVADRGAAYVEANDFACYCNLCDVGSWGVCKYCPSYDDKSDMPVQSGGRCLIQ